MRQNSYRQCLFRGPIAPDPKTIEEVETLAAPNAVLAGWSIVSEEDGAGEDALEAVDQPAVMRTVLPQVELLENFGGGSKEDRTSSSASLPGWQPRWGSAGPAQTASRIADGRARQGGKVRFSVCAA